MVIFEVSMGQKVEGLMGPCCSNLENSLMISFEMLYKLPKFRIVEEEIVRKGFCELHLLFYSVRYF